MDAATRTHIRVKIDEYVRATMKPPSSRPWRQASGLLSTHEERVEEVESAIAYFKQSQARLVTT
jgi:hypothetical protein